MPYEPKAQDKININSFYQNCGHIPNSMPALRGYIVYALQPDRYNHGHFFKTLEYTRDCIDRGLIQSDTAIYRNIYNSLIFNNYSPVGVVRAISNWVFEQENAMETMRQLLNDREQFTSTFSMTEQITESIRPVPRRANTYDYSSLNQTYRDYLDNIDWDIIDARSPYNLGRDRVIQRRRLNAEQESFSMEVDRVRHATLTSSEESKPKKKKDKKDEGLVENRKNVRRLELD